MPQFRASSSPGDASGLQGFFGSRAQGLGAQMTGSVRSRPVYCCTEAAVEVGTAKGRTALGRRPNRRCSDCLLAAGRRNGRWRLH